MRTRDVLLEMNKVVLKRLVATPPTLSCLQEGISISMADPSAEAALSSNLTANPTWDNFYFQHATSI